MFRWEEEGFKPNKLLASLPQVLVFNKDKNDKKIKVGLIPDFGSIILGWENVHPNHRREVIDITKGNGPLFKAPEQWTWAHIAKFFCVMPSVSAARRSGWVGKPDEGFNFRIVKINKNEQPGFARVKGEILVLKVTQNSPWHQS